MPERMRESLHDRAGVSLPNVWEKSVNRGLENGVVLITSTAMASRIRQHIVDRRVNSVRAADPSDATLIQPAA
ncbi:hypothetical protein [Microbacterium lacticum]